MHYFEEEFSSHYLENINSSSQFQRFEKRKLQNVKVTCSKFGTCERNDGNLIKLGFQPKSKILASKISNIVEGNTISVNPFLNSGVIGFLRGSKQYVCADGFNECINSCCYEGLCRYSQNYCERVWSQNTKMAYAPAVVFFIALVAYWITFIVLGIMYSKKTTSVVVQTAKSIKRKKNRDNDGINISNKFDSNENKVSEEKIENFNDPFNQDKDDNSNFTQNNFNSNDGFNYKDYDESKMKNKIQKIEDFNAKMSNANFNSNNDKKDFKNNEMNNINGDYNSMMTNIKLIKPLDSIEDIKQYNDQMNKTIDKNIKTIKNVTKIDDLNDENIKGNINSKVKITNNKAINSNFNKENEDNTDNNNENKENEKNDSPENGQI